jgi:hypothetical protein
MSTIVTDTITGKSTATTVTIGSTPVVSASANSMTIRGEGSNQTSIQQGLAKHWVMFQGTDTFASRDSLNLSSLVDDGTAVHTTNYTSNFANDDYASSLSLGHTNINSGWGSIEETNTARTTSSLQVIQYNGDFTVNSIILHGDLA